jgi:hypothetical protein
MKARGACGGLVRHGEAVAGKDVPLHKEVAGKDVPLREGEREITSYSCRRYPGHGYRYRDPPDGGDYLVHPPNRL